MTPLKLDPNDPNSPFLAHAIRDKLRTKHYAIRTETTYLDWIKRYIAFHKNQHPAILGAAAVETFLSDLAVDKKVAAPTQNQPYYFSIKKS